MSKELFIPFSSSSFYVPVIIDVRWGPLSQDWWADKVIVPIDLFFDAISSFLSPSFWYHCSPSSFQLDCFCLTLPPRLYLPLNLSIPFFLSVYIPFEWQESNLIKSMIELFTIGSFFGFDPDLRRGKKWKLRKEMEKEYRKICWSIGIVSFPVFYFHKVKVGDEVNKRNISLLASRSIPSDIESILRLILLTLWSFLVLHLFLPHFL